MLDDLVRNDNVEACIRKGQWRLFNRRDSRKFDTVILIHLSALFNRFR